MSAALALCAASPAVAAQPDAGTPDWHYPQWLAEAPHAPLFGVRDTVNKYGRYAAETKTITIKDLIKFHGHFCGGLVESAAALKVAFDRLFQDAIIDRTDLAIASNNSACGCDVAARRHRCGYLSPGRAHADEEDRIGQI